MKRHTRLAAIFLAALMGLSAVSFTAGAVDGADDSEIIVDPDPQPEPDPQPDPEPEPDPQPEPDPVPDPGNDTSQSSYYSEPDYSSSSSSYYSEPDYSSDTPSYDDYNYSSSDNTDYNTDNNNYYSSESYYYSEPSYVGGGQSYVAPSNTAPSASLIKTDDNIDENTLSSNDWSDISKRLKNADTSSDADDFSFIKNNTSSGDNGHWMLYVAILLIVLSLSGITYFIVSTVLNKKRAAVGRGRVPQKGLHKSGADEKSAGNRFENDDYNDDYSSTSPKKEKRASRFDTAEIQLPKHNSKGGRRYK